MEIPEWIATLIGQLVLENHALRQELSALRKSDVTPPKDSDGNSY